LLLDLVLVFGAHECIASLASGRGTRRTVAEFLAPFESGALDGRLELRRHAARWLPDPYLAAFRRDGDLGRYAVDVAGFFRAAFGESLWACLDEDGPPDRRAAVAARFDELLQAGIEARPDDAACRWHVVVLDIARPPS
jgi:hypothetical protein